jgi:DNA mismatch repair protein MSH6
LAKSSAAIEPSSRPEFVEDGESMIEFKELRHPTLCLSTNLKSFIPNDVSMGGGVGKVILLTGVF